MRRAILVGVCLLAIVPALPADERYYVVLFAAQDSRNDPRSSHTFATFLRIDREEDPRNRALWETARSFNISWLPASGSFRLLQRPVAGRNYTLPETLKWADGRGLTTTMRGPFEIGKDVYERAAKQKERLESGAVAYKALDRRFRPDVAINCIHAVSDILPGPLLMTGDARGEAATAMVANHFRPHLIDPERTHSVALRHLDLNSDRVIAQFGSTNGVRTNNVAE
jgi:hypothetical protein